MTETMWIRGEGGVLQLFDLPLPEGIAMRLGKGDLVHVNADGTPYDPDPDLPPPVGDRVPPVQPDDGPLPDGAPALPKRTATRAVWQDFAVSQGMNRATAAAATKAELIEEFTRPRE